MTNIVDNISLEEKLKYILIIKAKNKKSIKNQFTLFVFSSSIARRDKEQAKLYSFVSGYIEKPFSKEIAQRIYFSNEDLKIDGEGNSAAANNSVNKLSAND